MNKIFASLASIPSRQTILANLVDSIAPQVDELHVYLNGYPSIPSFLKSSRISVYTSQEFGDIGDVGKFFPLQEKEGYLLTLDDDIIYPSDYVKVMCDKINQYQQKTLICVHGNVLPPHKISTYYGEKQGVHFAKSLAMDKRVDVPGTGTMAFHSSTSHFSLDDFLIKNMTDLWVYRKCLQLKIPIIAIARDQNWLRPAITEKDANSIYTMSHCNDSVHTDIVNEARGYCYGNSI